MAPLTVNLTLTEVPQFARLVQFAEEVEGLAQENEDDELIEMVDELRADLQRMLKR